MDYDRLKEAFIDAIWFKRDELIVINLDNDEDDIAPKMDFFDSDDSSLINEPEATVLFYKSGFSHPINSYDINLEIDYYLENIVSQSTQELINEAKDFSADYPMPYITQNYSGDIIKRLQDGKKVELNAAPHYQKQMGQISNLMAIQAAQIAILMEESGFDSTSSDEMQKLTDIMDSYTYGRVGLNYPITIDRVCYSDYLLNHADMVQEAVLSGDGDRVDELFGSFKEDVLKAIKELNGDGQKTIKKYR